jgi:hypothetical protein
MTVPETVEGGPAKDRPQKTSTATTITGHASTTRRPRPKPVFVSLYEPAGRRRLWWYSYKCTECGTYQLGRARELDKVTGTRKAGCGHQVEIVIARTYRSSGAA